MYACIVNEYKCEVQCDDRKQLMIACLIKQ